MNNNVSLIIFSVFGEKDRWKALIILSLYPFILKYLNIIYDKIILSFNKNFRITFSQKYHNGKAITLNPSYNALCWYCSENYIEMQKYLLCETFSQKNNEKIGLISKTFPLFIPVETFKINNEISISFSILDNEKSVTLYSPIGLNILKRFVNDIETKYQNHFYGKYDSNKIYVCDWKHDRRDGDFEPKEMSIHKTFKNIYLTPHIENTIKKDLKTFFENKQYYLDKGIPYKRGYLFYGIPGTGKNSLCYAISREFNMNIYRLDANKCSKSIDLDLKDIVNKIPPRSILFLDEIDMNIYNDRKKENKETNNEDVKKILDTKDKFSLSSLMEILDGYDSLNECLVILTTNHKESLDPALIRPGRIDLHFHLDELDYEDIKLCVKKFTDFDIVIPKQIKMSSSVLINQILLPYKNDKEQIMKMLMEIK